MNYLWELTTQILRDMRKHKTRSFLAMFGIIWGTVAIVLLLALGEGYSQNSQKSMASITPGSILFFPGTRTIPYQGFSSGQKIAIKADDILAIRNNIPEIKYISLELVNNASLTYKNQQANVDIRGVLPDFAILQKRFPAPGGRFIDALDVKQQRQVIILSYFVADKLFDKNSALQNQIYLNGVPFTVIGVLSKHTMNVSFGEWNKNSAIIPYTTAQKLWGNMDVSIFMLTPQDPSQTITMRQTVINYLSHRFNFDPKDKNALMSYNPAEILAFFNWFFRGIELFLGLCGALTLGVGGIGVANVMYLIVEERTSEIGLRMALGARTSHILFQFLLEAGLIIVIGSLIGFILSFIGIVILHHIHLPKWLGRPEFSTFVFFTTVLTLATIGLIAGYFPARRAAQMTPVSALTF